jgi:hypothetical protein
MEWKSPESCGAKKVDRKYIAVRGKAYHQLFEEGRDVIHNMSPAPSADGVEWELATVSHENEEFYWGMFVEGLGFFHVMFPKEQTRPPTAEEAKYWSGRQMGMFGSHSGNLSYMWAMPPIVE